MTTITKEILEDGKLVTLVTSPSGWYKLTQNKGNTVRYEDSDNVWREHDYDEAGRLVSTRGSHEWANITHNKQGEVTHYEDSNGKKYSITYDKHGTETSYKDHTGRWTLLLDGSLGALRVSGDRYWCDEVGFGFKGDHEQSVAHFLDKSNHANTKLAEQYAIAITTHHKQTSNTTAPRWIDKGRI
jgi:YD repeat-containing protein